MFKADEIALLKLAMNGTALALLAAHEEQTERVENGYLEARRYDLVGALDAIEAYLTEPTSEGKAVLERARGVLACWEAYKTMKAAG